MTEAYTEYQIQLATEERRRTRIGEKLLLAFAVVPESRNDSRVKHYYQESFGIGPASYSRAVNCLSYDPRVNYGAHGFELASDEIELSETEQKFVDFVRTVTSRFMELAETTRPIVTELEQEF